ncbi:MAG: hypothetical protein ACRDPF_01625 [Streptosporangiaceae bacterium]
MTKVRVQLIQHPQPVAAARAADGELTGDPGEHHRCPAARER